MKIYKKNSKKATEIEIKKLNIKLLVKIIVLRILKTKYKKYLKQKKFEKDLKDI